jgi:uncharacterized protein (TIGR02646 family)
MPYISRELRQKIIRAAHNRCEYCRTPQDLTFATFHIDHIIPKSSRGRTVFENLCLSCPFCNQFKKGRMRARDPEANRLARLFNPRRDRWEEHFRWSEDGTRIIGLTAQGRATVEALRMNNDIALNARQFWVAGGSHPPKG